jgi:hypothetical protein
VQRPDVPSASRRHVGDVKRRGVFAVSTPPIKEPRMTHVVILASSLLAVVLALAWRREFRLRKAMQNLLSRIFAYLRNAHATEPSNRPRRDDRGPPDAVDDDRMRSRT